MEIQATSLLSYAMAIFLSKALTRGELSDQRNDATFPILERLIINIQPKGHFHIASTICVTSNNLLLP
jgi:hypothetical protein